ncbi:DUF427 domain-containing protein [Nakamurella sp.]|uniref:DUF427 domain-containing protein n=1 Tax=Nakamurella sp. TaxID=1869182 RepID=UPI00378392C8
MARSRPPVTPIAPGPGQESVWDYPRPPALQRSTRRVRVMVGGAFVADTVGAYRVLETSHPPSWYLPREDIRPGALVPSRRRSTTCEWKGAATYWDVVGPAGEIIEAAAWSYERPTGRFVPITGYVSFMPSMVECRIDDELVRPQAGGFYGGWITDDVVGPFKGEPGTWGW